MSKKIVVVGSGFAGMSAASVLAKRGHQVTVLEKNEGPGGRARTFEAEGYRFDMGPSWYWMPDVFERYFALFDKKPSDYYDLVRLDPSYRVYYGQDDFLDIPAGREPLREMFESIEPGSAAKLDKFLKEAAYKYEVGMNDLVYKPSSSWLEFAQPKIMGGALRLHVLRSFARHARAYFKNQKLLQLLEFPVLFLGAVPEKTPALYSLMNYADMVGGTWYPMGGMHRIVEGMHELAQSLGVNFQFNQPVHKLEVERQRITGAAVNGHVQAADAFIGGADYHHVEQALLPKEARTYTPEYWEKRTMAPSCLLWYVGVDKRLKNLRHHNLFFDRDFGIHAKEIYETPQWPSDPLFYASCPSQTDPSVAPEGHENLFLLVPVAPGLTDTEEVRAQYYDLVMDRLEKLTGQSIRPHVDYVRSYAPTDFTTDYNAFKSNAYGLANTLKQTAVLKPSMQSSKIKNLYYTGQLTVPGPGVPPALISGQVVANLIDTQLQT